MAMGGRVAEELVFGKDKVTSGAAGDIQQVTKIARAMVTRLGFSEKLGTVMYGENQEEVFLGYSHGPAAEHLGRDRQDDRRGSAPPGARGARDRDAASSPSAAPISRRSPTA